MDNVKLLYASAPGGKLVKIPLVNANFLDTVDISSRLRNAGIPTDQFPYVIFSTTEPAPKAHFLNRAAAAAAPGGTEVSWQAEMKWQVADLPPIPVPSTPNLPPDEYSSIGSLTKLAVTDNWANSTHLSYNMKNKFDSGYVNVLGIPRNQFCDLNRPDLRQPGMYDLLHSGRVQLCYGPIWHLVDFQRIASGDHYTRESSVKHGMSTTDELSVSATVGYSGYGASASLTVAYSHSVTVTDEQSLTQTYQIDPEKGKIKAYCLWLLSTIFILEVDGVRRDPTKNPLEVAWVDDCGNYHSVIDAWDGRINGGTDPAVLYTTPFPATVAAAG